MRSNIPYGGPEIRPEQLVLEKGGGEEETLHQKKLPREKNERFPGANEGSFDLTDICTNMWQHSGENGDQAG